MEEQTEQTTEQVPASSTLIDNATDAANALKIENDRKEALLVREEEMMARKALGGHTEAGIQAPKPTPMTDREYAEALERGEVNPLKDDGLI